jgi:hypothetical protein
MSLPLFYRNSAVAETKDSTANGYEHTKCSEGHILSPLEDIESQLKK